MFKIFRVCISFFLSFFSRCRRRGGTSPRRCACAKNRTRARLIYTMNTFKNDSDRETQSLLNEEVIIDAKKKQKSTLFNTRNVLLVGGLVATGGMVGLSGNAKSAASSQNTTTAYKLGQDRPTIRLSVGCTPQDVLSLLPFEPKSWRGALLMIVSLCLRRRFLSSQFFA